VLTSRAAFESAFPGIDIQVIHGDAPYHNMIPTPDGMLWSDFELVTMGAIESDLAMVSPADIAAYNATAQSLGCRPVDERVSRLTEAAGRLATVAVLAMAPDLPMLLDGVSPMVEQWRASPTLSEFA
jgi:thiamine kinase-like enzyme